MSLDQAHRVRRVDESMDILNDVVRNPVDPDYAVATHRRARGWLIGLTTLAFGIMVGTSVATTVRAAPQIQTERAELVSRVRAANVRLDGLRDEAASLAEQNRELQASILGADSSQARFDELDLATGGRAARGPGVVILADDGDPGSASARVVDVDLRQAVNALWSTGAEAIAINGHRLSARTAIRGAGDAITVDYRSLTRPYRIEAIGDAPALAASFPGTTGGQWWAYLAQTYGIRFELTQSGTLELPADPGLGVDHAKVARP